MSLSTYADLQASIANYLARDDLTTYIPDFITLFEASAARRLRVQAQEVSSTLSLTNGQVALPTDYLQMRRLTLTTTPYLELAYVPPQIYADLLDTTSGIPYEYTIEAATIKVRPVGDDTNSLQIVYFGKTSALSSVLNWLWTNHPDAYIFGSLVEANAFVKGKQLDDAQLWEVRRDKVFDEIQLQEFRSRPPGMSMRVMGPTP